MREHRNFGASGHRDINEQKETVLCGGYSIFFRVDDNRHFPHFKIVKQIVNFFLNIS